ncbi:hypothetical protein EMCRGX_G026439 [Ephydatia muelleri]
MDCSPYSNTILESLELCTICCESGGAHSLLVNLQFVAISFSGINPPCHCLNNLLNEIRYLQQSDINLIKNAGTLTTHSSGGLLEITCLRTSAAIFTSLLEVQ